MGLRIHQLPPALANQIAAGEVIERPASVVKELLENTLDAGATRVTIEIGYGGLNHIKISDDGHGIMADDLPLAVAAHATSKISTLDDLYAISSMGFRGEALASIASVAKMTIRSKTAEQEHAMMLRMQGTEIELMPCARAVGTTVEVVDLFYNAPVRKKFLKNEKLEFQAIELVVKRFALSAPHLALVLKHNGVVTADLPAALNEASKRVRLSKIFGAAFMKDAVFMHVALDSMTLQGWLSGPSCQRSQHDRQWVYINQRMVKDKLINHAIKQAYDGLLYPGRFPSCLLYFSINSGEVDVNVHPTKHEVRFQQPRLVHDFFTSHIVKALAEVYALPEASDGNECPHPQQVLEGHASYACAQPQLLRATDDTESVAMHSISNSWNRPALRLPQSRDTAPARVGLSNKDNHQTPAWVLLHNRYALMFLQEQPHLVDVVALYQHWMLQRLKEAELPLKSRPLLVPIVYSLQTPTVASIADITSCLKTVGIEIDVSAADRLLIRSIPIMTPYLDVRVFFDTLCTLKEVQTGALFDVLSSAQAFAPCSMVAEERFALQHYLMETQHPLRFSRLLTVEDCRMLVDV